MFVPLQNKTKTIMKIHRYYNVLFSFVLLLVSAKLIGNEKIDQIEKFIITNQNDSALKLLQQTYLEETPYLTSLKKILLNDSPTYADYQRFTNSVENKTLVPFTEINDYLNEQVTTPEDKGKINIDYVKLRWIQITNLRNYNFLDLANELNNDLHNYVNQFDISGNDVKKAIVYLKTHDIVMAQIAKQLERSKTLCKEINSLAVGMNDTSMMILSLYHLSDHYILIKDLQSYIEVSEKSFQLDNLRQEKSNYYHSTIQHLVDAYIYKGGAERRVLNLLETLYQKRSTRTETFSYYANLLKRDDLTDSTGQFIFQKFGTSSLIEFSDTLIAQAHADLNPREQFYLYSDVAKLLAVHGYFEKALDFQNKAMKINTETYSEQLSKSLAANEGNIIRREKELEVEHEKEKNSLYVLLVALAVVIVLVLTFVLFKMKKQTKLLAKKNVQIETALYEKQLLLKEVHHRVKNNFQIVSSLLELQSRGIEDDKARELAEEGKNRVKSMALIHQNLYQNDNLSIPFADYVEKLVAEISSMYGKGKNTKITYQLEDVSFDVDTAIPLGLIVNELITNAFKYGSSAPGGGEIEVSIHKKDENYFELQVKDNGQGMPEGFDISTARSLGLRLVKSLSKQLHGNVQYSNDGGTLFSVLFKNTAARILVQ